MGSKPLVSLGKRVLPMGIKQVFTLFYLGFFPRDATSYSRTPPTEPPGVVPGDVVTVTKGFVAQKLNWLSFSSIEEDFSKCINLCT